MLLFYSKYGKWILREITWTGFIWLRIWTSWRAVVNTIMNLRVL
jgi:hypothetical protein